MKRAVARLGVDFLTVHGSVDGIVCSPVEARPSEARWRDQGRFWSRWALRSMGAAVGDRG